MEKLCRCGVTCKLTTSWSDQNPARRFLGCSNYGKAGACRFFEWYDEPICKRGLIVIPGLIRKLNRVEDKVKMMKTIIVFMGLGLLAMLLAVLILASKIDRQGKFDRTCGGEALYKLL